MSTITQIVQIETRITTPQKIKAQPGLPLQLVIDGVAYVGQKKINGKAVQLVRKGSQLEVQLQDQTVAVVEDFYISESTAASAASGQTQALSAKDTLDLLHQGSAVQVAAAPVADALSLQPMPQWGTLVAQATPTTTTSSAASASAVVSAAPESSGAGVGALLLGALGLAAAAGGAGGGKSGGTSNPLPPADTTTPTATVTDTVPGTANGPVTYTIAFDETVKGFDASKVSTNAGTLSGFTASADGKTYTLVLTPPANATGTAQLSVSTTGVTDAAGNVAVAPTVAGQAYDTVPTPPVDTTAPTISVTDNVTGAANGPVTFTLKFSEAVTGFSASKLSLSGGTLGSLVKVSDSEYTVVATPAVNTSGTLQLSVSTTGVTDAAGNVAVAPAVAEQAYAQNVLQGSIVAGPLVANHSLSVKVFDATGQALANAQIDVNGKYKVAVGNYSGPVSVLVVDADNTKADYMDEVSKKPLDLSGNLLVAGVVSAGNTAQTLNINPITTVAALKAGLQVATDGISLQTGTVLDTNKINTANNAVAKALLGSNATEADLLTATIEATVNTNGSANASANTYGKVLAALAGMDAVNNGDASKTLNALVAGISDSGTLSGSAQTTVTQGANAAGVSVSDLPTIKPASDPTPDPGPTETTITGVVMLGPAIAGNGLKVKAYNLLGVQQGSDAVVAADGSYSINIGGYTGGILLKVVDSDVGEDYRDEATGNTKDLNGFIMAVDVIGSKGTVAIHLNALTTTAAVKVGLAAADGSGTVAGSSDAAQQAAIADANAAVAAALGLGTSSITKIAAVATVTSTGADNTANDLGKILAALSQKDADNAGNNATTITQLAKSISGTGSSAALTTTTGDGVITKTDLVLAAAKVGVVTSSLTDKLAAGTTATGFPTSPQGGDVSGLDVLTASKLTQAQIESILNAGLLGNLSPAALAVLNPTYLAAACAAAQTPINLSSFTTTQLGNLTGAQIAALAGTDGAALVALASDTSKLQAIGTDIRYLAPNQLTALSADQVKALTDDQLTALTGPQIAVLAASGDLAKLSAGQIAKLGTDIAGMTSAQLQAVIAATAGATPAVDFMAALDVSQVKALAAAGLLTGLSGSQITSLGNNITALSAAQVASLGSTQLDGLTSTQIGQLAAASPSLLTSLTGPQIAQLGDDITGLSADQLAALGAGQLSGLTGPQLGLLAAGGDLAKLTATQLAQLDPAKLGTLSAAQLQSAITASANATPPVNLLDALTGPQIAALADSGALATLSAPQVQALGTDIGALTSAQFQTLVSGSGSGSGAIAGNSNVLGALTAQQVAALGTSPSTALNALTATQLVGISDTAIGSVPAAKLALLDATTPLGSLSVEQLSALSSTQLGQVGAGAITSALTQAKLQALEADISGLPATSLAALAGPQVADLLQTQVEAITPGQITELVKAGLLDNLAFDLTATQLTNSFTILADNAGQSGVETALMNSIISNLNDSTASTLLGTGAGAATKAGDMAAIVDKLAKLAALDPAAPGYASARDALRLTENDFTAIGISGATSGTLQASLDAIAATSDNGTGTDINTFAKLQGFFAPTVTITDNVSGTANGDVTFTFTFTDAVTGFDASKVTLTGGGTKGTFTPTTTGADAGKVYTLVVTSLPVNTASGTITVQTSTSGVTRQGGSTQAIAPDDYTQAFDTLAPTLHASTAPATALTGGGDSIGDTIVLTVTFDGPVNGLTSGNADGIFQVAESNMSAIWSGSNASNTRTLTYTVATTHNGQVTISEAELKSALQAGITDGAGNAFTYTLANNAIAIPNIDSTPLPVVDGTAPNIAAGALSVATLDSSGNAKSANLKADDKIVLTVDLGEAANGLTGLPTGTLTAGSGAILIDGVAKSADWAVSGNTLTLTHVVQAGETGAITIGEAALKTALGTNIKDAKGNAAVIATSFNNLTDPVNVVDTLAPTLHASTAPATALTGGGDSIGDTIVLTVTFDGPVNGLTSGNADGIFQVAESNMSAIWSGSNASNTRTLTYTVATTHNGQVTISEAALKSALQAGITDGAGNAFTYTLANNEIAIPSIDSTPLPVVDGTAPNIAAGALSVATLDSSGNAKSANLKANDKIVLTVDLGEAANGLTGLPTGTLAAGSGAILIDGVAKSADWAVSGNTLTLTHLVQAGETGAITIDEVALKTALGANIKDTKGNAAVIATSFNNLTDPVNVVDTAPPSLSNKTTGTIAPADNLVLTFDNPVTANTGNIRIYKSDNTLIETISVTDGDKVTFSGNNVTINPAADLVSGSSYYAKFPAGAFKDAAGNLTTAGIDDNSWAFSAAGLSTTIVIGGDANTDAQINLTESGNLALSGTITNIGNVGGVAIGSIVFHPTDVVGAGSDITLTTDLPAITGGTWTLSSGAWVNSLVSDKSYTITVNLTGNGGASGSSTVGNNSTPAFLFDKTRPTVGGPTSSKPFTEMPGTDDGNAAVTVNSGVTITETGSGVASATVTITNAKTGDVLLFTNDNSSMGNIAGSFVGNTLNLTSEGNTATLSQWLAVLKAVRFNNTSDAPDATPRSIEFKVIDRAGNDSTSILTETVTVSPTNDAPVVGGTATPKTFREVAGTDNGANAVVVNSTVTVSDVDGASEIVTAQVQITNAKTGDVLSLIDPSGKITGSYIGDTLTLSKVDGQTVTDADFQAALRLVKFNNTSDTPNTAARTITFKATDAALTSTTFLTETVTVTPTNDAPVVGGTATTNIFTEVAGTDNGTNAVVVNSAVTVSDVDGASEIVTAKVEITNAQTGDVLSLIDPSGKITGSYSADTLTLSKVDGQTVTDADFQAALRLVKFNNTSDTPNTTARTITFKATDAALTSTSILTETVNVVSTIDITNIAINGTTGSQVSAGVNHLNNGDTVSVTVTFDDSVTVTGSPTVTLNIGGQSVTATYASGSPGTALVFTTAALNLSNIDDTNGISITAGSVNLNTGSIKSTANSSIDAALVYNGVSDNTSYKFSSIAPVAVDLKLGGTANDANSYTVNATEASNGKSIASGIQAPSDADIDSITLSLGGAVDAALDKLVFGANTVGLDANISTVSNVTVGGVAVDYSYNATSQAFTITKNGGGAFTASTIDDMVAAILFKTTSTTQGGRTVTVGYTDLAGNSGATAAQTLNVETVLTGTATISSGSVTYTNYVRNSETFDSIWTKGTGITVVSNSTAILAPNGTATADFISEGTTANRGVSQASSISTNGWYTFSAYVRAGGKNLVNLTMSDNQLGNVVYTYDLTEANAPVHVIIAGNNEANWTNSSAQMTHVGEGWYRVSLTAQKIGGSSAVGPGLWLTDNTTYSNYTPTAGAGLYVWGAQLEQNSGASSYIPTGGAAVSVISDTNYTATEMLNVSLTVTTTGVTTGDMAQLLLDGVVVATSAPLVAGTTAVNMLVPSSMLSTRADGTYAWSTRLTDAAGNVTTASSQVNFFIDTSAADTINSWASSDFIRAGGGADTINLGSATVGGRDTLVYLAGDIPAAATGGADAVSNFKKGELSDVQADAIKLVDVFTGLTLTDTDASGTVSANEMATQLVNGGFVTLANSGSDVIISIDKDGTAGSASASADTIKLVGQSLNSLAGVGSGGTDISALTALIANSQFTISQSGQEITQSGQTKISATLSAVTDRLQGGKQFDNVVWSKNAASVTANASTAPDGTMSADLFIPNTANTYHEIKQTIAGTFGSTYSVYIKPAGVSYAFISFNNLVNGVVSFDLINGTVGTRQSGVTSASVENVGNGWYRLSAVAGGAFLGVDTGSLASTTIAPSVGNGTSGFYLWDAKLRMPASIAAATSPAPVTFDANELANGTSNVSVGLALGVGTVGDVVEVGYTDGGGAFHALGTSAALTSNAVQTVSVTLNNWAELVGLNHGSTYTLTTRLVASSGAVSLVGDRSWALTVDTAGGQVINNSSSTTKSIRTGSGADTIDLGNTGGQTTLVYKGTEVPGAATGAADAVSNFKVGVVSSDVQADSLKLVDVFTGLSIIDTDSSGSITAAEKATQLVNGGFVTLADSGSDVIISIDKDGAVGSASAAAETIKLVGQSLNSLAGVGSGATAADALTALIGNGQFSVTRSNNRLGSVSVSGVVALGESLRANVSDADGMNGVVVSYQWMRNGVNIEGARGQTFVISSEQVDSQISVRATYMDASGSDESVVSPLTEVVARPLQEGVNDTVLLDATTYVHGLRGFVDWDGVSGDRLVLNNLLSDFVPGVSNLGQWVNMSVRDGNTTLMVDVDGAGSGTLIHKVFLQGVDWSNKSVASLASSGVLVTNYVTLNSLLTEMENRASRAMFPQTPYTFKQFSSTEPTSNDPSNANGRWFANDDFNNFVRKEGNEYVIFDDVGPGAVVRLWCTSINLNFHNTVIKFYIDGQSNPIISGSIYDIVRDDGLVSGSNLSYSAAPGNPEDMQGCNLYLPIPYQNGLKITVQDSSIVEYGFNEQNGQFYPNSFFYYSVGCREYGDDVKVQSFSHEVLNSQQVKIASLNNTLSVSSDADLSQNSEVVQTILTGGSDASASLNLDGSRAISSLVLKINASDMAQALRSTVIAIDFDGQERVWVPVGEFFGTGYALATYKGFYSEVTANGDMKVSWHMPFQTSAEVSVINYGNQNVSIDLNVGYVENTWTDDSMYFNAKWHQYDGLSSEPAQDLNYITINGGRGVYVGDTLSLFNSVKANESSATWWGEGDEKIYVDGELLPSIFGTGTEDYYGFSHSSGRTFYNPFTNQVHGVSGMGMGGYGPVTDSRYRLLDGIVFNSSLKFDMELWHGNVNEPAPTSTVLNYSPAVFYYSDGNATDNIEHDLQSVRAVPYVVL